MNAYPRMQAGLTEEERRTAQLLKAEFESSGIHLPANEREEVRALLNEITALETEFSSNVIMRRTGFQVRSFVRSFVVGCVCFGFCFGGANIVVDLEMGK